MNKSLYEPFNDERYALRLQEGTYTLDYKGKCNNRKPSVQAIVKLGVIEEELGFQFYNTNFPVPLPSNNSSGKSFIRAILISKYLKCFGYDDNFNVAIMSSSKEIRALQRMTSCRTMSLSHYVAKFYSVSYNKIVDRA
eukprot:14447351-Ditylum_brightwellii.AAC.1